MSDKTDKNSLQSPPENNLNDQKPNNSFLTPYKPTPFQNLK